MTARKIKGKRKMKKSFKIFAVVCLLLFTVVFAKIIFSNQTPDKDISSVPPVENFEDTVEPLTELERPVPEPDVTITPYNEYMDIKCVSDGKTVKEYPVLKDSDLITENIQRFIDTISGDAIISRTFYNKSYFSIEFDNRKCMCYDVKNHTLIKLEDVAPELYEQYGEVPFFLGEDFVSLLVENIKTDIPFENFNAFRNIPYNPPEYTPAQEGEKVIALTFDDGPRRPEITEKIIDKLIQHRAKATFFVLGCECPGREKVLSRITETGNEIGNHSWRHEKLNDISRQEALATIKNTQDIIFESTGVYPSVMRAPYGSEREDIMEELGLFNIGWSVDPEDWKNKDAKIISEHIKQKAVSGSIVLMHDVYDASGEAAMELIDYFCSNGWRLVTVSELFDLKNKEFTHEVFHYKA
ncbi:MAG: polysaccharide deacetylase family protein [Clostridia bacterium]|nr:polysaccharide deacetylase family protein [Clostridia bacterium]